jgi:hypothetical protein
MMIFCSLHDICGFGVMFQVNHNWLEKTEFTLDWYLLLYMIQIELLDPYCSLATGFNLGLDARSFKKKVSARKGLHPVESFEHSLQWFINY